MSESLGKAKGTSAQQFQTLSMRTWVKDLGLNIPAKLIHSTLQRAIDCWSKTKPEKNTNKKIAEYFVGNFTLITDPKAWNKGRLYPKFWKKLPLIVLRYKHKDVSIIGHNCLTIYKKFGRWYLSQPSFYKNKKVKTDNLSAIALDPGLRNFLTGFDGQYLYQFGNAKDLEKLLKLSKYIDKLISKRKKVWCLEHKRKIFFKIERLRKKLINLKKELIRKTACYLSKNFDVIFMPEYSIKNIFSKKNNNKKNNRTSRLYSHYMFRQSLAYHCVKNGSVMVTVNEAYTSKTCSRCGHIHYKLGSNKIFNCPKCNHILDRDLNGAINIFNNSLILCQGGLG